MTRTSILAAITVGVILSGCGHAGLSSQPATNEAMLPPGGAIASTSSATLYVANQSDNSVSVSREAASS